MSAWRDRWRALPPRQRTVLLTISNLVLSGWLAYLAVSGVLGAKADDLYVALPQAAVDALLAVLVLFRRPPSDVRLTLPVLLAVVVSNGHFALYDMNASPHGSSSIAGSVLLVGSVYLGVYAHLTLARSFSILPAVRELRTGGPYRVVRHPIYLALILSDLGLALSRPSPWNGALSAIGIAAHVVRVFQEEAMWLRHSSYRQYRRRTRFRLVPFVF